jgi:hypothetical protein
MTAPVATDGMRPWTELNPCDVLRKYAGLLLEQPMPDSLMTSDGSMPSSKNESMMRSVIALCPHPAQSVVLLPRYETGSSPILLIRFPGTGGCTGVDMIPCFSDFVFVEADLQVRLTKADLKVGLYERS